MLIGYARTSTLDQKASIEAQVRELSARGCDRILQEQVSSVDVKHRDELARALELCRQGNTLAVTKLDRLARDTAHLLDIAKTLDGKGAGLWVIDLNLDTATPTGKLMLTMLGGVAQFEREIMLERQREGIEKARREGKYKGRQPTARAKADQVRALRADGVGATAIARQVGISRASVYRILDDDAAAAGVG